MKYRDLQLNPRFDALPWDGMESNPPLHREKREKNKKKKKLRLARVGVPLSR
jgi:hypothetical protein